MIVLCFLYFFPSKVNPPRNPRSKPPQPENNDAILILFNFAIEFIYLL